MKNDEAVDGSVQSKLELLDLRLYATCNLAKPILTISNFTLEKFFDQTHQ